MTRQQTILFDLDDTLVHCGASYEATKDEFKTLMEGFGMPRDECERRFTAIDLARLYNKSVPLRDRFPTSMGLCYQEWVNERGYGYMAEMEHEATRIGYSVYEKGFPLMEGAARLLLDLDAQGYRVSLYTAGDEAIQIKKCVDAGIWWMLHEITAVERKDARTLRDYLRDRNISPAQTWMIGNSPKADMLPALSVGIPPHQCILLESYTWEADHAALPAGVARVRRLDQIPSLIAATRRVSELV